MPEVKIKTDEKEVKFEVEIVKTPGERAYGLMNRQFLDENCGMLFIEDKEGVEYFWMKNTLIPLDIIFIGADFTVKHICQHAYPCGNKPDAECPLYSSVFPVKYALEIAGDLAKKLGIFEGQKVEFFLK